MVFDDETEFDLNENTTSNESKKKEPQLEKYGVWIKKGPENLESPQEISDITDNTIIDDDFTAPEQEQLEINEIELDNTLDTQISIEETISDKTDSSQATDTELNISSDFGLPEGLDMAGIDLSAFENDNIVAPPVEKSEPEGEVSIDMDDFFSSDSGDGEVDLSSFFGDGESIDFDDFMGGDGKKKEPEIEDQEPLDIQLEFDDNFVLETKADPVSQVEFIGMDGEFGEMSFDDLFDNIQDEGSSSSSDIFASDSTQIPEVDINAFTSDDITSAFMDDTPAVSPAVEETKSSDSVMFDDASEFDDLLSSLDEASPLTETPEEAKHKKLNQDYDITVTMEEEDLSEDQEETEDTNNEDLDDIPLFQSEEDIENFKQTVKNNGTPVGGMKVLEAQSSMDFDEIDKILEDGGFEFPSDEVKDVTEDSSVEVTIDDVTEIAIDDIPSEEISFDTETSLETSDTQESENEISIEDNFMSDNMDSIDEIEVPLNDDVNFDEPMLNETIEEENEDDELNVSFEEPKEIELETNNDVVLDDDITLTDDEPEQNLEDEIVLEDDAIIEEEITLEDDTLIENELEADSTISDPVDIVETMEAEETLVEEPILDETSINLDEAEIQEDNSLDETFSDIEEPTLSDENTNQEIIEESVTTQEDALLDMDFTEDVAEVQENSSEEELQEDETNIDIEEESSKETITEEQGEIMEENNIINNSEAQNNNNANSLLEKIAAEITNLRSEITTLRDEFNSLKVSPNQETTEEAIIENSEEQEDSSGFFSDDNEDETIALSGDELSNLMSNADFTTEEAIEDSNEEILEEPSIDDIQETTEELEEETQIEDSEIEQSEEVTNPLGDATELSDADLDTMDEYEDESFADETEASDFADEDLKEPELEDLQINNNFDDDSENYTEEIDVPKDNETEEVQETNDFIESIQAEDPSISDTLTEDRLKYLEDTVEDSSDENEERLDVDILDENGNTVDEAIEDTVEENEEIVDSDDVEIAEEQESYEDEDNEPTEDVFNSSQWDNEVSDSTEEDFVEPEVTESEEIPTEEELIEEPVIENDDTESELPEDDFNEEEVFESPVENTEQIEQPVSKPVNSATAKIQDDIKSVLVYMDQLLENLPEDKIEEFAKSEHFDTYKKLFNDLGISN